MIGKKGERKRREDLRNEERSQQNRAEERGRLRDAER